MSTYSSNVGLIDHYISPIIGYMKLNEITICVIEKYYQQLLKTKPVDSTIGKKKNEFLTPHTVRSIHKLLQDVKDYKEITDDGRHVIMSHYAMPFHKAAYNENCCMLPYMDYTPRTLDEIIEGDRLLSET